MINGDFLREGSDVVARSGDLETCGSLLGALRRYAEEDPILVDDVLISIWSGLARVGKGLSALKIERDTTLWLERLSADKTKTALSVEAAIENRTRAIALLALLESPRLQPIAAKLLRPNEPDAVRVATIKLLGRQRDAKVADLLLEAWPTLTPAPREAALQAFAARPQLAEALLSAIEQGRIKAAEISPTARTLMTKTSNVKLRNRATKLFAGNASRQEVVAKFQGALALKGNIESGRKVYQTVCAVCHRKGDEGRDIGPNLATVLSWTPEQLLTNILDPNREVAPNFLLYIVETNDNRILSGIITSETPVSVSLKGADGVEQSIPRSEVKSLKSAGVSIMPEGVEAALTPQQMADLMAFIRGS
jgi:putative heme-binding domain-containing protein